MKIKCSISWKWALFGHKNEWWTDTCHRVGELWAQGAKQEARHTGTASQSVPCKNSPGQANLPRHGSVPAGDSGEWEWRVMLPGPGVSFSGDENVYKMAVFGVVTAGCHWTDVRFQMVYLMWCCTTVPDGKKVVHVTWARGVSFSWSCHSPRKSAAPTERWQGLSGKYWLSPVCSLPRDAQHNGSWFLCHSRDSEPTAAKNPRELCLPQGKKGAFPRWTRQCWKHLHCHEDGSRFPSGSLALLLANAL